MIVMMMMMNDDDNNDVVDDDDDDDDDLSESGATIDILYDMDSKEVGSLLRNQKYGSKVSSLVQHLPYLYVETSVHPITRSILR